MNVPSICKNLAEAPLRKMAKFDETKTLGCHRKERRIGLAGSSTPREHRLPKNASSSDWGTPGEHGKISIQVYPLERYILLFKDGGTKQSIGRKCNQQRKTRNMFLLKQNESLHPTLQHVSMGLRKHAVWNI